MPASFLLAFLLILAGTVSYFAGMGYEPYKEMNAPRRISAELMSYPPERRSREWYKRLHAVETPHKRLVDVARGLWSAAVGVMLAAALWNACRRSAGLRRVPVLLVIWFALWLIRIPFSYWYYGLRQERFDYPVWADSIAIPVGSETVIWLAGGAVSTLFLLLLLVRCSPQATLRPARPATPYAVMRAGLLGLWILLLAACVLEGVWDGDEGMVLSCTLGAAILVIFLSASPGGGEGNFKDQNSNIK